MTDELKGRLERLGERAPVRSDALEELRVARDRRDRRRARSALVVGLSVFVVVGLVAVTTLRDPSTTPVPQESPSPSEAWALPEAPYLWPENWARIDDRELLANVQQAADEGTPAVEWRLDPEQVVRRFLTTVLAWERPDVITTDLQDVFRVSPACGEGALCVGATVRVSQPAVQGDGGIWSVTEMVSEDLGVPASARLGAVSAGSDLELRLRVPDDRAAHAGIVAANGCREASEFAVGLEGGTSTLVVPEAEPDDPTCGDTGAGYLFVYAMDDTTVPTGDPLLEAAAIEYPWLTMVPVAVRMRSPSADDPVPTVAVIGCSGPGLAGTEVLTPVVAARSDGVHVEVRNTSGMDLGISFATRGENADVGTTELVLDSAPGDERALCLGPDTDPGDPGVPFEIVDPQGYWTSTVLDGTSCAMQNIGYGGLPEGIADPIEAARDALGDRVREGDELVLAGYPDATVEKVVVLRRDGTPIASVEMFEGASGWVAHTVTTCS